MQRLSQKPGFFFGNFRDRHQPRNRVCLLNLGFDAKIIPETRFLSWEAKIIPETRFLLDNSAITLI